MKSEDLIMQHEDIEYKIGLLKQKQRNILTKIALSLGLKEGIIIKSKETGKTYKMISPLSFKLINNGRIRSNAQFYKMTITRLQYFDEDYEIVTESEEQ